MIEGQYGMKQLRLPTKGREPDGFTTKHQQACESG